MVDLLAALGQLDTLNDAHWTADGAPRMDVLVELTGDANLTRKNLTDAYPLFNRENTDLTPPKTAEEIAAEELAAKTAQEAAEALAAAGGTGAQGQGASQQAAPGASEASTETGAATAAAKAEGSDLGTDDPLLNDPAEETVQEAYDDDNPEHLRRKLAGFDEALADAKEDAEFAKKNVERIQSEGDRIRDKLNVLEPNPTNGEAIRDYIASQHRIREEKFVTRKQILGGLKLKDIQARSPIDEAMARKTTRGTARPVRTV